MQARLHPEPPAALLVPAAVAAALRALLVDVPPAWVAAAAAVRDAPSPADVDAVCARIGGRVGWRLPGVAIPLTLGTITVRLATVLQLEDVSAARCVCHMAFLREALGVGAAAPVPAEVLAAFYGTLERLWRVRWENEHKEALWRLAVDGIPLLGNSHLAHHAPEPCGCGAYGAGAAAGSVGGSPRAHHFWACPVAQAVVRQVAGCCDGVVLRRAHLWLVQVPSPAVQQCVWDVVCLAAVSAMERGRRALRVARRAAVAGGAAAVSAEGVAAVCRVAVADFWSRLRGFAALGVPRKGWRLVGPAHPVLRVEAGRMCVADPVAAA